jgi:hypothetical protein
MGFSSLTMSSTERWSLALGAVTSLTLARIDFIARWLGQHLATQRRRFRHEGITVGLCTI